MRLHPVLVFALVTVVFAGCTDLPTAPDVHLNQSTANARGGVNRDILYQVKASASPAELDALAQVFARHGIARHRSLGGGKIDQAAIGNANGRPESLIAADIEATGAVEFAEVDEDFLPAALPNDSLYATQWHHAKINSAAAWDIATGSASIIVAVCDGGVELTHPDLAANIHSTGYNVVDHTFDGSPVPSDGGPNSGSTHGTKVAGMLGAVGNNTSGVTGVNWTVEILPIRVTNDTSGLASLSKLIECVDYARSRGAKVVNVSYSGIGTSSAASSAGEALMAAGGLLVVSAGNDGANFSSAKNYPGIIVVGGTDENDAKTSFSNYGPFIDLVAPAIHISTTRPTWRGTYIPSESGTSFASPIVAGVAALIWSAKPALTAAAVQDILFKSAKDLGTAGYDKTFGNGRVDAGAALAMAVNPPPPPPPPPGKGKGK